MAAFIYQNRLILLPNPVFGDKESIVLRTKIRRSMSGQIWAWRATPALLRWTLRFEFMSRSKILEMIAFLRLSAGRQLQYIDYRDDVWQGYILDMDKFFESVDESRNNSTFQIQFEGTKTGLKNTDITKLKYETCIPSNPESPLTTDWY